MINDESLVFNTVAAALRNAYSGIYVTGEEVSSEPPRFPAVTIVQTSNEILTQHSTFDRLENVAGVDYKIEVYSNLQDSRQRFEQAKAIGELISDTMVDMAYIRTFCQPIPNATATISRRVLRFRKITLTEVI